VQAACRLCGRAKREQTEIVWYASASKITIIALAHVPRNSLIGLQLVSAVQGNDEEKLRTKVIASNAYSAHLMIFRAV